MDMAYRYCLDTCGFSNPLELMPDDIHRTLWDGVKARIEAGTLCWNTEIAVELASIPGEVGQCLVDCRDEMCLEVGVGDWDYAGYLAHVERMRVTYEGVISEYNANRKRTVGLNDISIIALAKTLNLPLLQEEKPTRTNQSSTIRMKIPDVCSAEDVKFISFNDFLRAEGIQP